MATGQGKEEAPRSTKPLKFATFAMRGFGSSAHVLAVGIYGDDLIASAKRCVNARGDTLIADVVRFRLRSEC